MEATKDRKGLYNGREFGWYQSAWSTGHTNVWKGMGILQLHILEEVQVNGVFVEGLKVPVARVGERIISRRGSRRLIVQETVIVPVGAGVAGRRGEG